MASKDRWPSCSWQQTEDLPARAYAGSNPALSTITPCVISSSRQRPPLAGRTAQCFYSMEGLCAFSHASFVNMGNPCRSLNDLSCRPTACPGPLEIIAAEPSSRSEEHTSELQSLMRISYA